MVFFDVQKAFNRIWQVSLIYKLKTLEIPHQQINITKSFLKKRTFQIGVEDSLILFK